MKENNHSDCILTHDHFWSLCLFYTELATYVEAFIPDIKEHTHYIVMDVMINVYLQKWDLHNEAMRKDVFDEALNNAKKYKFKTGLEPYKLTFIRDIMKSRELPIDDLIPICDEEGEVFKLIYFEGFDMYTIADMLERSNTEVASIYNKCIELFAALYVTAKLILSGKAQQPALTQ